MELKLPALVHAKDYHEFAVFLDMLNQLVKKDSAKDKPLAFEEIHFSEHGYVAVFYDKKRHPKPEEICALVLEKEVPKMKAMRDVWIFLEEHEYEYSTEEVNAALNLLELQGNVFKRAKAHNSM